MGVAPGVDTTLMFTIAEASATFVAIVAGFLTTKIISISGEKKRLRSRIAEVEAELTSRGRLAWQYKRVIDRIEFKWARESIDSFVRSLLMEEEIKVYSLDELKDKFRTIEEHELDEYEDQVLHEKYEEIKEMIRNKLEGRSPSITSVPLGLPIVSSGKIIERESAMLNENRGKFMIEESEIMRCENMKTQYQADLEASTFPLHMAFGFMSQIIFAILGVAIPLTYASWSEIVGGVTSNIVAIGMFGIGLVLTFVYMALEIIDAKKA